MTLYRPHIQKVYRNSGSIVPTHIYIYMYVYILYICIVYEVMQYFYHQQSVVWIPGCPKAGSKLLQSRFRAGQTVGMGRSEGRTPVR